MQNTFLNAWKAFFHNLLNFEGETTRKDYWSVMLPIMVLQVILGVCLAVYLTVSFIELLPTNEESLQKVLLVLSESGYDLFGPSLARAMDLSLAQRILLENLRMNIIYYELLRGVLFLLTISLSLRRFQNVGFTFKGSLVLLYPILISYIIPINAFLILLVNILYSFYIPLQRSYKYFSHSDSSLLKKYLFKMVDK